MIELGCLWVTTIALFALIVLLTFIVLDWQKQQFKHIFANNGAGLYFKYNADPSTSDLMKHFNTG